jgi:hypothetical protein
MTDGLALRVQNAILESDENARFHFFLPLDSRLRGDSPRFARAA